MHAESGVRTEIAESSCGTVRATCAGDVRAQKAEACAHKSDMRAIGTRERQAAVAGGSLQRRGVADWDSQLQLVGRFGQLPSNVGALPGSGRALPGKWASGPRPERLYRPVGQGCERQLEAARGSQGAAERKESHPRRGVSVGCEEAAETAKEGCFHRL